MVDPKLLLMLATGTLLLLNGLIASGFWNRQPTADAQNAADATESAEDEPRAAEQS